MRAKKILAILLSLVMVLGMMPSVAFANDGLVSGASKAAIEIHLLNADDSSETSFHPWGDDDGDITYGSKFYLGFYAKDFANIKEMEDGLSTVVIQFEYDPNNLRMEPEYKDTYGKAVGDDGSYDGDLNGGFQSGTGAGQLNRLLTKLRSRVLTQPHLSDALYYAGENGGSATAGGYTFSTVTVAQSQGNLYSNNTGMLLVTMTLGVPASSGAGTYVGKEMTRSVDGAGGNELTPTSDNQNTYLAIVKFQVIPGNATAANTNNNEIKTDGSASIDWYVENDGWSIITGDPDGTYTTYGAIKNKDTADYLFDVATTEYPNPTEGVMELGDLSAVQKKVFPKMYTFSFSGTGGTVDTALTSVSDLKDTTWTSTDTSSVEEGAKSLSTLPTGDDAPSYNGLAFKEWALRKETTESSGQYIFKPLSECIDETNGLVIDDTDGWESTGGVYKLYPIFAEVYTVTVYANGGKFTIESADATTITSAEVATDDAFEAGDFSKTDFGTLKYDGYDLVGFNSKANGTGDSLTITSGKVLPGDVDDIIGVIVTAVNTPSYGAGNKEWYAQWEPSNLNTTKEYTEVNFNINATGSNYTNPIDPAKIDVADDGHIMTGQLPDNPTWTNGGTGDDLKQYTFLGWNTKADGSGDYLITTDGTDVHKIKGDTGETGTLTEFPWDSGDDTPKVVNYYAIWNKGTLVESDYAIKVEFNDNGATTHVGSTTHANSTSTLMLGVLNSGDAFGSMMPSEPAIASKGFGGWFVDKDGNGSLDDAELAATAFTSATPVETTLMADYGTAEAVKLIAQWIDSYTIKFDANAGGTLTAPTDTTGLTFEGTSPNYTSVSKTFDGGDSFGTGDLAKMFASVQRTDYKLIGWNTKADGTDTTDATAGTLAITWADTATPSDITTAVETAVTGYGKKNLTLYAIWEASGADVKTVSFDLNVSAGTAPVPASYSPIKVNNGDTIATANLPTPTRENYTFIGWYVGDATGKDENKFIGTPVDTGDATEVNDNITLYARWSAQANANDATVEFYNWDTTAEDFSSTAYATVNVGKFGDPLDGNMPADPTIGEGYAFKNWYIGAAATAKTDYAPNTDVSGKTANIFTATSPVGSTAKEVVKVYAYYVPEYIVSFNPNGGVIAKEGGTIGTVGTVKATSAGTADTDYYAVGIETGKTLTDGIDEEKLPVAANDATQYADNDYVYKVSRVFTDASSNEHAYTFKEWNTAADGSGTAYANLAAIKAISAATDLYAIWEYNGTDKVTVSFHQNEGEDRTATTYQPKYTVSIAPGDKIDASLMPAGPATTRAGSGYVFDSWNKETNGSGDTFDSSVEVSDNLDVYAIWKPSDTATKHTVKFVTGVTGGVVTIAPDEIEVVDNTTILEDYKPTVTVTTAPSGKTLGTEWKYYVTANEGDADRVDTTFTFGTTPVTGDWTIYPVWKDDYVVTFSLEGGEIPITATSTHAGTRANATDPYVVTNSANDDLLSADIPNDSDVTRTGYTFMGWSTASNGSVAPKKKGTNGTDVIALVAPPKTSITLYAIWEPANPADTYIVNFDDNGTLAKPVGTASNPAKVKVYAASGDTEATYTKSIMPNIPVRDGYEFKGWAKKQNATTPDFFTWNATNTEYTEASANIAKTAFTDITSGDDAGAHETTVYAVWEASGTLGTDKFTVTFAIETSEGTIAPSSIVVAEDDVLTDGMMATVTAASGWSFQNAWKFYPTSGTKADDSADFVVSTGVSGQSPAATTITQDITIYPVMAQDVELKFYPNTDRGHALTSSDATDKANIKTVPVTEGGKLTDTSLATVTEPTRTGYDFVGWILIDKNNQNGKLYEKTNTGTDSDPVYEYIYDPEGASPQNITEYVVSAADEPLFAAKWEATWYIKLVDNDMPYDSTKATNGYEAEIDTIKKDNTDDVTDGVEDDYDITYATYTEPTSDGADPSIGSPSTTKPTTLGKYAVDVAAKDMKLKDSDTAGLAILKDDITSVYDVLTIRKAIITIGRLYDDDDAANTALGYTDTNVNKVENGQKYTISTIAGTEALLAKVVNVDNLTTAQVATLTDAQTKAGGDFFDITYVDPSYDTTDATKLIDLSGASDSAAKANTYGDYVAIITLKSPYDTNYTWAIATEEKTVGTGSDATTENVPVFETYEAVDGAVGTPYIKLTINSSASIDDVDITQAYTVKTLKTAATATTLAEYQDTQVAHTDTDAATGIYENAADVKSKAEDAVDYDKDTKTYYVGNIMPGAEVKLTLTGKLVTPSFKLRKHAVDANGTVQSTLNPAALADANALPEYDSSANPAQTSYYKVGTGSDEGKYIITIAAEDLMAVDGVNTVDNGFYNELTVEMPSASDNITFKLRLLKNPEIKLNYGNTPYGLIMRDDNITDKDAAKTAFNASNMFTAANLPAKAKANLRYAPQAFGLTTATADDPKNFDRNEFGQGIYNRAAFKDAGFVVTNSLGETVIDTTDSTKDTIPAGATFTRMIQIDQLKVVSNLISVISDSDLVGKPVVEITTDPTANITALSSIPLRPNIYSMDYAYEDEMIGGYALNSRDICLLWTEGDVDMSGAINSGDSTYTANYYAKRAKPYDKLTGKDKNIVATLHLYRIMDVDQSGAINSGDTTKIKNIYAKRATSNVYYPAL